MDTCRERYRLGAEAVDAYPPRRRRRDAEVVNVQCRIDLPPRQGPQFDLLGCAAAGSRIGDCFRVQGVRACVPGGSTPYPDVVRIRSELLAQHERLRAVHDRAVVVGGEDHFVLIEKLAIRVESPYRSHPQVCRAVQHDLEDIVVPVRTTARTDPARVGSAGLDGGGSGERRARIRDALAVEGIDAGTGCRVALDPDVVGCSSGQLASDRWVQRPVREVPVVVGCDA